MIGLGAIGAKVANIGVRLGMEVYGYDPFVSVDAAWGLSRIPLLKLLKSAMLVSARREGKQMIYSLADEHVRTIIAMGVEHVEE